MEKTCSKEFPALMGETPCPKWTLKELNEEAKRQFDKQMTISEQCPICNKIDPFEISVTPKMAHKAALSYFEGARISKIIRLDFEVKRVCDHNQKFSIGF